ncbi:MAG: PAS domain S-box protein [Gammaproteobacteria bacterium]|nr:PAS domain S-box protein [Gammaproteobacteria bacterium]
MSLRFRLNLIITVLVVLFTAVIAAIVIDNTRRSISEEMNAGRRVAQQMLTSVLESSGLVPDPRATGEDMLVFLESLGRIRAHEIRYYHAGGWLMYTSPPPTYKAGREAPRWFARLVSPPLAALEFALPGGRIVVTTDSSRAVLDAWDDLTGPLWLVLVFLAAINALVFFLVGRFLRPLGSVLAGLSEMERGRFETRLPHSALPEFEAISHTFNRMANALRESQTESRRLALIAEQSSDAIVICDLSGNISYWNPAAARLFGYAAEDIVGHSSEVLIPHGREAEVATGREALRQQRVIENLETQRLGRDGRLIDVALSAAPLIDPNGGAVIGEIFSIRDITEHKSAQKAAGELERNRQLTQLIQSRVEEERRALARELHDELGQCVTGIRTIGTAIAQRTRDGAPDIHDSARTIVEVAGHIYDVVHDIVRQLRPPALDNLGLREALEDLLAGCRERLPDIACELTFEGVLDDLGETVNITIYRIVQECLTNIARHAGATRAEIAVTRRDDRVEVRVCDDGKGLDEQDDSDAGHFGLMGMRERVQALHGRFELESRAGGGVQVFASIPIMAAGGTAQPHRAGAG